MADVKIVVVKYAMWKVVYVEHLYSQLSADQAIGPCEHLGERNLIW